MLKTESLEENPIKGAINNSGSMLQGPQNKMKGNPVIILQI